MSKIESMTHMPQYRKYIDDLFKPIGIKNIKIPKLPERLMYGKLSELIHKPDVSKVYIMSDEDEDFQVFMQAISKLSDIEFEEINAEEARSGDIKR